MDDFPRTPAHLTPELLSRVLRRDVATFDAQPIGGDRGMLGELVLVRCRDAAGREHEPVVAKFACRHEGSRAASRRAGTFAREVGFYRRLAPLTPVRVPVVHAVWHDTNTDEFAIVQEAIDADLSVDQLEGLDLHRASLVVDEIARLHARWWAAADLGSFPFLPRLDSQLRRTNLGAIARDGWDPLCRLLGGELDAAERGLGAALASVTDERLVRLATLPSTLLHSDLRADNLLFARDGSGVVLIDWQGAGIGPGGWDLAYFVSQSLTVEGRRLHEAELLSRYLAGLRAGGVAGTDAELLAGYGESMLFGLLVATSLPVIADVRQPRVARLAQAMARRAIEAMRDHGSLW